MFLSDRYAILSCGNRRTDRHGGSPENRVRLTLEVTQAVIEVSGTSRCGVRISPLSPTNGMSDEDPHLMFTMAAERSTSSELPICM